jgi:hypothetical protein
LNIGARGVAGWFSFCKDKKLKRCNDHVIEVNSAIKDFDITNDIHSKTIEPKRIHSSFVTHLAKEFGLFAQTNKMTHLCGGNCSNAKSGKKNITWIMNCC